MPMAFRRAFLSVVPYAVAWAFLLGGCASGQVINLQSTPSGAVVYLVAAGSPNKRVKIGPTPARYSAPDSDEPLTLVFEREGFLPKEVVVAAPYRGKANVSVQLNTFSRDWFREMLKTELASEVNFVMEEISTLPDTLASKNDLESERALTKANEKFGRFALFHSAAGTFYYSRKKYSKAKFHFLEVLRLTPEDVEARNMLKIMDRL
ncbi:MAG: hypothetical protein IOD12_09845 [Silvanigrellales bacterium]|nr:hypothetical protein [Silvanigrellales bacterium]